MKKFILLLLSYFFSMNYVSAQLINRGGLVYIEPGMTLGVKSSLQNTNSGILNVSGTLEVTDSLENNASLSTSSSSIIRFNGQPSSFLRSNGSTVYRLDLNKTNNANLSLLDPLTISNSLQFNENAKLILNANNLIIGSSATISQSGDQRYIVTNNTGQVIKSMLNSTPFTFPVGYDESTINPIQVSVISGSENIGVRVLEKVYTNGNSGQPIDTRAVDATWVISEGTQGGTSLNLNATWSESDELPLFNRGQIGLSRYDNTSFDIENIALSAAAGTNPYTISRSDVSPGVFAIMNSQSPPLPINLVNFSVSKLDERKVLLKWTTSTEKNADYFAVEKSYDNKTWEEIGRLNASGNSTSLLEYKYLDHNLALNRANKNIFFYRLKNVDFDEVFTYSDIKAVVFDAILSSNLTIYPNPARELVLLDLSFLDDQSGKIDVHLLDMSGRVLSKKTILNSGIVPYEIDQLHSGQYLFRIKYDNKTISKAWVKIE